MHWKNSNFGIKNFLANGCHTPDEAYRILKQLYEERDVAIRNAKAEALRTKAKILRAEQVLNDQSASTADKLEAEANLMEIEAFKNQGKAVLDEAIRERDYITSLIEEIQPYRKYTDLPDHEAYQQTQSEEWKCELVWRAENFLASQGTIPADHLSTMRLHPDWDNELLPKINSLAESFKGGQVQLPGRTLLTIGSS